MKAMTAMVWLTGALATSGCTLDWGDNPPVRVERLVEVVQAMEPGRTLAASSSNGSIQVAGWDQPQCQVKAAVSARGWSHEEAGQIASAVTVTLVETGGTTEVRVDKPAVDLARCVGVSLDVSVPRQTAIDVQTSNGNVAGRNLVGAVKGRTSNGNASAQNVTGPIDLHTSNGNVTCEGMMDTLRVRTSNGSVDITCAPESDPAPDVEAQTSNGNVTFTAPAHLSARIVASTSNGSITSDRPILVQGKISKSRLEGTIGDGRGTIHLRTSNGSIHIR